MTSPKSAPPDFNPAQWDFLAALAAFGRPVSVDAVIAVSPLTPGLLLDLLDRGEGSGLIEREGSGTMGLAAGLPPEVRARLDRAAPPEKVAGFLEILRENNLWDSLSPAVQTSLYLAGGLSREAGRARIENGRQALASGRYARGYDLLLEGLTLLGPVPGDPDDDQLFVGSALEFSSLSFSLGKDFLKASDFLEQARDAAGRLGDQRSRALIDLHLGRNFYLGDRRLDAIKVFSAGRQAVEALGDEDILIQSSEFIGLNYFIQGLHAEAIVHLERATQAFENHSGLTLINPSAPLYLGYCAAYLGQFHRAIGSLDSSWRRAKREANRELSSSYRAALGAVLLQINKKDEALIHLKAALKEGRAGGNALAVYSASGGLAYHSFLNKNYREAHQTLALLIAEGAGSGIKRQFASPYIMEMLFEFDRMGFEPISGFTFGGQVSRIMNEPSIHLKGVALRLRAVGARRLGDDPESIMADLLESEENLRRSGDPIQLAKTRAELARLSLSLGQREQARRLAHQARKGLSGHSENHFPDGLRFLLDDPDPQAEAASAAETLKTGLQLFTSGPPTPDLGESLDRLVAEMNRLLGAERGGLFWAGAGKSSLTPRGLLNLIEEDVTAQTFRANFQLILKSLKENRPLIRKVASRAAGAAGAKTAALCLPLAMGGRVRGVLYHDNSYLNDCFDGLDQELLTELCRELGGWVGRAEQFAAALEETRRLAVEDSVQRELSGGDEIVTGPSRSMAQALDLADRAAQSDGVILIQGETGVGKELLARRIHERSPRSKKPLVTIDPTTIPESLVESELFGYEKGAFTGADSRKPGRVELAHQGTLFIDEITEIPPSTQVKLLRVLQEKSFVRIGGTTTQSSDFRLIAATNRNLEAEVAAGRFRQDLYYRLNIVSLSLPPLRERRGDALILARYFLARYAKKYNRPELEINTEDEARLAAYHWPGNVRELKNLVERAVILSEGNRLRLSIPSPGRPASVPLMDDLPTLDEMQRRYIRLVLEKTNGRIGGPGGAAEILGMKRTSVHSRLKQLGINRNDRNGG